MLRNTVGRPMEILLVEDSLMFARIAIDALKKGNVQHRLTWLNDGLEAWGFLTKAGKYLQAPRPDMLLLDLMLPGMDGTELLARLRASPELKSIPVVVMTGEGDTLAGRELAVEALLTKPLDFDKFISAVERLSRFWQDDMIVPLRNLTPAEELPVVDVGETWQ